MAPQAPFGRFGHGAKRASEKFILKVGSINCFQSILFLFRADFRAEGGSNAVHCNRLTIGKDAEIRAKALKNLSTLILIIVFK